MRQKFRKSLSPLAVWEMRFVRPKAMHANVSRILPSRHVDTLLLANTSNIYLRFLLITAKTYSFNVPAKEFNASLNIPAKELNDDYPLARHESPRLSIG